MIDSRSLSTGNFPVNIVFLKWPKSRGRGRLIEIFQLVVFAEQWCVDIFLLNVN
jgi:hypothetical protein